MAPKVKALFLLALLIPCWGIALQYDIDLPTLYNAVHSAVTGSFASIYNDNGTSIVLSGGTRALGRYFYPPFSLAFFAPLGFLPYSIARLVWIGIQTGAFLIAWFCLEQIFPILRERSRPGKWIWLLAWLVSINPVHNNFQSNNIQLILAALLLGGEVLTQSSQRRYQILAGVLVTIPTGLKVYPLFLLPLFWLTKSKPTRVGILLGLALIIFLPYLTFGPAHAQELYARFFENVTTYGRENRSEDLMSLSAFCANYFAPLWGESSAAAISRAAMLLISAVFYCFVLVCVLRRAVGTQARHFFALAMATMVLVTPSTRPHYLFFLVPAFISIAELAFARRAYALLGGLSVAFAAIALTAEGVVGHTLNQWLERWKFPVWGILLLTCLAAYSLVQLVRPAVCARPDSQR